MLSALWLLEALEAYRIIIMTIRRAKSAHMECCVVKLKPPCRNAATVSSREVTIAHLLADTHHQFSRGPLDWITAAMRTRNNTKFTVHSTQTHHHL